MSNSPVPSSTVIPAGSGIVGQSTVVYPHGSEAKVVRPHVTDTLSEVLDFNRTQ